MTVVADRVRRVRYAQESTANFGVEQAIGSFIDLPLREDSVKLTLNKPMESPMLQQQYLDAYPSKVFLPKDAQLDFATNLRAASSRAGSAQTNTGISADAILWAVALGGQNNGTGTTIATTSTTSALNLTSAAGLREGGALACATGAGGALECREIKTIATNTVTLKHALSSVPANASVVYAPCTVHMGNSDGASPQTMEYTIEGLSANDRWLLRGCQVKAAPTFDFAPGGVPKVTWSWAAVTWDLANGVNTTMNLTAAAIADQAYSDSGINAVMDSEFRVTTLGTVAIAGTLFEAPSMSIVPSVKYVAHKTVSGLNTVKQWVRVRTDGAPVTGEFVIPHEATTMFDLRDSETERSIFYQIGSSVTNGAVLISVPRVCFEEVQREEVDGIAAVRVKWYAKHDNNTTTNTTDLQKSPFRIHFF